MTESVFRVTPLIYFRFNSAVQLYGIEQVAAGACAYRHKDKSLTLINYSHNHHLAGLIIIRLKVVFFFPPAYSLAFSSLIWLMRFLSSFTPAGFWDWRCFCSSCSPAFPRGRAKWCVARRSYSTKPLPPAEHKKHVTETWSQDGPTGRNDT